MLVMLFVLCVFVFVLGGGGGVRVCVRACVCVCVRACVCFAQAAFVINQTVVLSHLRVRSCRYSDWLQKTCTTPRVCRIPDCEYVAVRTVDWFCRMCVFFLSFLCCCCCCCCCCCSFSDCVGAVCQTVFLSYFRLCFSPVQTAHLPISYIVLQYF